MSYRADYRLAWDEPRRVWTVTKSWTWIGAKRGFLTHGPYYAVGPLPATATYRTRAQAETGLARWRERTGDDLP